jgi:hypothetical protein
VLQRCWEPEFGPGALSPDSPRRWRRRGAGSLARALTDPRDGVLARDGTSVDRFRCAEASGLRALCSRGGSPTLGKPRPGVRQRPGSGAAVAHLLWGQEVGGSNPPSPTRRVPSYTRGCSSMAEPQSSKLMVPVQSRSPAPTPLFGRIAVPWHRYPSKQSALLMPGIRRALA